MTAKGQRTRTRRTRKWKRSSRTRASPRRINGVAKNLPPKFPLDMSLQEFLPKGATPRQDQS
eukprot:5134437-Pyramimonas_sp.AAC.1